MERGDTPEGRWGRWPRRLAAAGVLIAGILALVAVPFAGAESDPGSSGKLVLAVAAVALLVVMTAIAVRVTTPSATEVAPPIAAGVAFAADETIDCDVDADPDVRHRKTMIKVWTQTLEDRWQTMSEADRQVAMEIIRRNSEGALLPAPQLLGATG